MTNCYVGWMLVLSMLLGAVGAEDWSLPDSRIGVRTAPLLLLTRADVQADVNLTDEQTASLRTAVAALYERAAHIKGRPNVEALAIRRQIDEEQEHWLQSQLNGEQRQRLQQIDLQWEGATALVSRSWVTDQVRLSESQLKALKTLAARARSGDGDRASSGRALGTAALDLLTEEQRACWRSLLGEPFTLKLQTASTPPPR